MEQTFFTNLSDQMEDRQECVVNIKKIGGDLVLMVTPDIKKRGTVLHMTGNPAEIDLNFLHELKKPVEVKTEFKSEKVENPDLDEDGEEDSNDGGKTKATKSTKKKSAAKKSVAAPAKKNDDDDKKGKGTPGPKKKDAPIIKPEADVAADDKKAEKEAADAKLKADKAAFDELMVNGKKQFEERKYSEAEAAFKLAVALFPEDQKAKKELEQATKWVTAMSKLV